MDLSDPQIPKELHSYLSQGKLLVANGLVHIIEFSGSTYQIQVEDVKNQQENWVFLQLNEKGAIKDSFCSCEREKITPFCAHIAAAFLKIYNNHSIPLHQRFYHSFWNRCCRIYYDRYGDDSSIFTSFSEESYSIDSISGKNLFFITGRSPEAKKYLHELVNEKKVQTEETSLKFSDLSQEEINLWKEGRPSTQLKYALSFWNDFAHWFMALQESQSPYRITFGQSLKKLPNYIKISFEEVEVGFYLSEASLPELVPSFSTLNSPLKVHNLCYDEIEKILYDKNQQSLEILYKEQHIAHLPPQNGYQIEGWTYVENDGFYPNHPKKLLEEKSISKEKIADVLSKHTDLIGSLLENTTVHREPITLSYTLAFDLNWNLHILAYAFNPGDLSQSDSKIFNRWIYIDDDGFYPLEDLLFPHIETTIPVNQVSDFVSSERSWLNTQEGFHTHLSNVEAQLSYRLDDSNRLRFSRTSTLKTPHESHDFGSWIYVAGQGFYAKISTATNLPLRSDIAITPEQIPLFIRLHRAELQLVPRFFSDRCPIEKSVLRVTLEEDETLQVAPQYILLPAYLNKKVIFFDEFSYVPEEGFYELLTPIRLPERYRSSFFIEKNQLPEFLSQELEKIQLLPSEIDQRIIPAKAVALTAMSIKKDKDQGGYSLKLFYTTERGKIPLVLVWKSIKEKRHFLFHEAGRLNLEEPRFDWIKILLKRNVNLKENTLLLSTLELIRLHALETIVLDQTSANFKESEQLLTELTEFHIPEQPNLEGLLSRLRPYQLLGIHWLWFLYKHLLSGLLCDEMGLGKTHQAMALMAAIINNNQKINKNSHFLIICPTSVIYHWQEKLQQFMPQLRICVFHGSNRSLESFHQEYDVLITSYGIWRLEYELLSGVNFGLAILDEVQIAKNHNSRLHLSLRKINAHMRLGLTGTPIENNLRELKALFDLIIPSYMPSESDFKESFIKPIEKEGHEEKRAILTRFIKPFILRRKKRDVLTDLPEKTEEIAHCDLSFDQLVLYNQTLQKSRQKLLGQLVDSETSVPYIHIFALLSSLKQICNHPAVFLKKPDEYQNFSSGKWDLFVELFNEARDSKQKVVIFSQYLAMLDILENYLNEWGIGYSTIRGSTINRGEQVYRFNNDPTCEVFLGSLQAAGLGVDLTAGSVVIHYDRWWNAAREDQATDRVHRIGQTRGVQVFKLVTKGTFEERIDAMIARKGKLMEEVVSADDHRFIKLFDRKELIELLQEGEIYH